MPSPDDPRKALNIALFRECLAWRKYWTDDEGQPFAWAPTPEIDKAIEDTDIAAERLNISVSKQSENTAFG